MTPVTSMRGKRLALFGLGGSGLATAKALAAGGATPVCWDDAQARDFFTRQGAEYISSWQVLCNADGCLTRVNERSWSTVDAVHLSEDGSISLIDAIAGKLIGGPHPAPGRS